MRRRRPKLVYIGAVDHNSTGYVVDEDNHQRNCPTRVTDLLVKHPTLKISRFALWTVLTWNFYIEMLECPDVRHALFPGTPVNILDRPVADAIFALAATGDCQALVRYIKMIP